GNFARARGEVSWRNRARPRGPAPAGPPRKPAFPGQKCAASAASAPGAISWICGGWPAQRSGLFRWGERGVRHAFKLSCRNIMTTAEVEWAPDAYPEKIIGACT